MTVEGQNKAAREQEESRMRIYIEGRRDGYSPEQCGNTMTVGDLIAYLEQFEEDTEVLLKNDNGYTYGRITENSFTEDEEE